MPIRFRTLMVGTLAILALAVAGCYPFQGDITLLLTPVAPPDPEAASRALEAISADASAEGDSDDMMAGETMVSIDATVAVDSLRVRQRADAETPIIAGLRGDTVISVVGRTADGSWLQVKVPDMDSIGWILAEMVTLDDDATMLPVTDGAEMMDAETSEEEASAEKSEMGSEDSMTDMMPSIMVVDQDASEGMVMIAEVMAQEDGWVVIHADDAGTFGPVIGYAPVVSGVTRDVAVEINTDAASDILYAMLHVDAGTLGVYEFPGPDGPVLDEGAPLSPAFTVTVSAMPMGDTDDKTMAEKMPAMMGDSEMATQLAVVATRSLRVRSIADADAEVLAGAVSGEAFPVASISEDGIWVSIFFPGFNEPVWVTASLVELRDTELYVEMGRALVTTTQGLRLRLRSVPSLDAPIVGHILNGTSYPTFGTSPDGAWALLAGTGVDGPTWASTQFLQME